MTQTVNAIMVSLGDLTCKINPLRHKMQPLEEPLRDQTCWLRVEHNRSPGPDLDRLPGGRDDVRTGFDRKAGHKGLFICSFPMANNPNGFSSKIDQIVLCAAKL